MYVHDSNEINLLATILPYKDICRNMVKMKVLFLSKVVHTGLLRHLIRVVVRSGTPSVLVVADTEVRMIFRKSGAFVPEHQL